MSHGLGSPQARLFGVGAKGAVDRQVEAGFVARSGGHAVEGGGDVRAHRLAVADTRKPAEAGPLAPLRRMAALPTVGTASEPGVLPSALPHSLKSHGLQEGHEAC